MPIDNKQFEKPPWNEPDFVDRMFDYLLREFPQIAGPEFDRVRRDLRHEFAGNEAYIPRQSAAERELERAQRDQRILALFNGRNATEVARTLQIGRATVYRILKQAGRNPK